MAREMELAREIQESLLPPSELSSGPLSVWAHFRPAAEVGGDYFDLFPLAPGTARGDDRGRGGPRPADRPADGDGQVGGGDARRGGVPRAASCCSGSTACCSARACKQRMVSFALAEIDTERREVKITSAGHQPGVAAGRRRPGGGGAALARCRSATAGPTRPPSAPFGSAAGSRLLLYSDGLVEGRNAGGDPVRATSGCTPCSLANREVAGRSPGRRRARRVGPPPRRAAARRRPHARARGAPQDGGRRTRASGENRRAASSAGGEAGGEVVGHDPPAAGERARGVRIGHGLTTSRRPEQQERREPARPRPAAGAGRAPPRRAPAHCPATSSSTTGPGSTGAAPCGLRAARPHRQRHEHGEAAERDRP